MSGRLGELCSLFVEDAFGELAGQIFTALAGHGRLNFVALRAALGGMPPHFVKRALVPLIQNHLVLHYAAYEDEPTFFSVDWEAAYLLLRTRKFLDIIEVLEGEIARHVTATILQLGHASVQHIADEYDKDKLSLADEYARQKASASKRDSGVEMIEEDNEDDSADEDSANGEDQDSDGGEVPEEEEELESDAPEERMELDLNTLHKTLRALLKRGILVKVNERTYIPHSDLETKIRDTVQMEKFPDGKIKGSKKSKEFAKEVNALKRKYQGEDEYHDKSDIASHGEFKHADPELPNNKRKYQGKDASNALSSSKRLKTSKTPNGVSVNGEVNGEPHDQSEHAGVNGVMHEETEHPVDKLPNDLVIRVNFVKGTVLLRNQRLVSAVKELLGPASAAVYAALLRALEDADPLVHEGLRVKGERQEVKEEDDSDDEQDENDEAEPSDILPKVVDTDLLEYLTIPTNELAEGMKEVIPADDLINGVGIFENDAELAELGIKQEPKSDDDDDDDGDDPLGSRATNRKLKARNKRLRLVNIHLGILAEHPRRFCIHDSATKEAKVDFGPIGRAFVTAEMDTIIHARYGKLSSRIIRLFRHQGKLDDFHVASLTLQKPELIELKLTELHSQGLIRIQEIPKDASRQPNRSIYLYWYDEEMARGKMLDLAYQAMGRCVQRLRHEEHTRFKGALEKAWYVEASLDDLEASERLTVPDKKALRRWREVEDATLIQLQRLDDFVLIMRDIGGTDKSLLM